MGEGDFPGTFWGPHGDLVGTFSPEAPLDLISMWPG